MVCWRPGCGGTLEPLRESLVGGTELQTVRCIQCGARKSRIVTRHAMARPVARPSREELAEKVRCVVAGCGNWCVPSDDGLCSSCRQLLRQWTRRRNHLVPPPLERVDGVWVKREGIRKGSQRRRV